MSKFNQKNYTTIRAKDASGNVFSAPVHKNSALAAIQAHHNRKLAKQQKQAFREFKARMREAKKSVPIEHRAKVNWS
jgi:hypothetical protein